MNAVIDLAHIHPVSDFVKNYKTYLNRIKKTGRPEVLTVNGVAECVVMGADAYQEMKDAWEQARFIDAVNEGIKSMHLGTGKPASQVFQKIRTKLGV